MNTLMKTLIVLILGLGTQYSNAFDIEDYATTYRATRDAYKKASGDLRLAEKNLIYVLKSYSGVLPMRMSTYSKIGSGLTNCSYLKDCAALTKDKKLAMFDSIVSYDVKLKNVIKSAGGSSTELADLRSDIVSYHENMDSSIITEEQILFTAQPATVVWDEDVVGTIVGNGGTDPFGNNTNDTMTEFRALRDNYLKALTEVKLARAPYMAAKSAYSEALRAYYNSTVCSNFMNFSLDFDTWTKEGAL